MIDTATPTGCHPLYHDPDWRDPKSGVAIPRQVAWESDADYLTRLWGWRVKRQINAAEDKRRLRAHEFDLCQKSFIYWCVVYGYTSVQVEIDDKGRRLPQGSEECRPFALWPMQDAMADAIQDAFAAGEPIFIDKSREIGATWVVCAFFVWLWLFNPRIQLMVMSRVEADVDNRGSVKTLVGKMIYMIDRLPPWMRPAYDHAHMRLRNLGNKAEILGTSTNKHAGRGARFAAALVDEAAAVEHFDHIQHALNDATPCPIYVTTALGPGPCFDYRMRCPRVFVAGYWDHPKKGRKRQLRDDPTFGRFWWTPYFEHERTVKRRDNTDLAQNLLCDWKAAASMVMDSMQLNRQAATYVQPSKPEETAPGLTHARIELPAKPGLLEHLILKQEVGALKFIPDAEGPWRFWCRLEFDRESRVYRPRQDRVFVIGADVSWGVGASNSTMFVIDGHTGEQVGEYESSKLDPKDFARQMAIAGYWWGGESGAALLAWEATGPGNIVGTTLSDLGYPLLYRPVSVGLVDEQTEDRLGWQANPQSLVDGFAMLKDAIARDEIQVRSEKAIADLGKIVRDKTGRITHGRLIGNQTGARATHADHATAVLVACLAKSRVPELKKRRVHLAPGSPAWVDAQRALSEEIDKPAGGWRY